ncbi:chondroitinase-B domain-containing protein, partial [Tamlana sp. 2201CG12-4]|uniref:chondroitinase-B domain-containing protein n=1 Tax=Tamlana sp. 2201CG12-4 TaxID=3112582 RepID=UPI002DB9DD35
YFTTFKVGNTTELLQAAAVVQPGDVIELEDGIYNNFLLELKVEGQNNNPITIKAENPGKAIIKGASAIHVYGDHYIIKGLYFTEGALDSNLITMNHPAQQTLVTIFGSHVRVTECVFDNFIPLNASGKIRYISNEFGAKGFPRFVRVDHCSFISVNRIDNGQFLALNGHFHPGAVHRALKGNYGDYTKDAFLDQTLFADAVYGRPLYNRVDHCYFGIADGSILRWGHNGDRQRMPTATELKNQSNPFPASAVAQGEIKTIGGSIFDANLVEGQRTGDGERIVSKNGQNIYLNNTFRNDLGQLSLRGGTNEVVIGNYFLRDDSSKRNNNKTTAWSSKHVIANNYFQNTKGAGLTLTSGYQGTGTGHDAVTSSYILYNTFETLDKKAYCIDARSIRDRRTEEALAEGKVFQPLKDNNFEGNFFFKTLTKNVSEGFVFQYLYQQIINENNFEDNYYLNHNQIAELYMYSSNWLAYRQQYPNNSDYDTHFTEGIENQGQIVTTMTGLDSITNEVITRDEFGLLRVQGAKFTKKNFDLPNLQSFPYDIDELISGNLLKITEVNRPQPLPPLPLFPGTNTIDLSDFGDRLNNNKPIQAGEVGAQWFRGEQIKISKELSPMFTGPQVVEIANTTGLLGD